MARIKIPTEIQTIIQEHGNKITLQTGEVLFRQHTPSEDVYLVRSGKLSVIVENQTDKEQTRLNYIMPDEIAGEIGAITGWQRTATLVAEHPTTLIQLSKQQFSNVLRRMPALAKLLMSTTGSYLVSADVERINLGRSYQQMQTRVCALGQEREQLVELLRLREEMEAMLVHDFRNPLNIIKTGVTLLSSLNDADEYPEDDAVTTILDLMNGAVGRMEKLANALLDISKMEAGRKNLNIEPFNIIALASTVINEQKAQSEGRHIELLTLGPLQIEIKADRDILQRVLVNLIDNALKFTPNEADIKLEIHPPEGDWLHINVIDTGPGIPEPDRDRIFEKFTRVKRPNAALTRKGTGLGLTFCQMAVEAHGGKIWVDAGTDNIGACFHIKLPLTQPKVAASME